MVDRRVSSNILLGPFSVGGSSAIRVVSYVDLSAQSSTEILQLLEQRLKRDTPPEILWIKSTSMERYERFYAELKSETSRLSFLIEVDDLSLFKSIMNWPFDGIVLSKPSSFKESDRRDIFDQLRYHQKPCVLIEDQVDSFKSILHEFDHDAVVGLSSMETVHSARALAELFRQNQKSNPILLSGVKDNDFLGTSAVVGGLICDGIGDVVLASSGLLSNEQLDFSYNLLQACGSRITKTEYVSCPSCGRTLFDLQSTTERIKSKTNHLKGVKIAIMGCIVNGPGEMADADFGYVGGGPGKINLYVGKTCVEKSIPAEVADQKLIDLIRQKGRWVDPE